MPDLTPQEMVERLQAEQFRHTGPPADSLSDPVVDTPMVVTLDQLRPYELDPRITRNPRYDDIKASIRARHLEAPPSITRRPGAQHYTIRNGGNTRLSILRELWTETRDEKFFRIPCLFRPWSQRGEIISLTGHLAENELRGSLSFIERALGIEKVRELYEQEHGQPISQRELARRLTADGYPVTQSHISRMQDTVRHLLPSIPSILYGGLGKPQIEKLIALRQAASRALERHASQRPMPFDFFGVFQDVLAHFDGDSSSFSVERVQDELIGQLAELIGIDYDALALEIVDAQSRQQALAQNPVELATEETKQTPSTSPTIEIPQTASPQRPAARGAPLDSSDKSPSTAMRTPQIVESEQKDGPRQAPDETRTKRIQANIISPAETTSRLQAIQRTISDATGEPLPNFEDNVVRAIPVQAGGLHPVADVWYIDPSTDSPDRLRALLAQLAREIAQEAGVDERIEFVDAGIGFCCTAPTELPPPRDVSKNVFARAVTSLLAALSQGSLPPAAQSNAATVRLIDDLAPMLLGVSPAARSNAQPERLSDAGLIKLYRLIRLARRLIELQTLEH